MDSCYACLPGDRQFTCKLGQRGKQLGGTPIVMPDRQHHLSTTCVCIAISNITERKTELEPGQLDHDRRVTVQYKKKSCNFLHIHEKKNRQPFLVN